MPIIHINNLTKTYKILRRRPGLRGTLKDLFSRNYRHIHAVKNISLEVEQGEIIGFIGPNGAGKSTTIKMLTGILKPTAGDIRINGYIPFKQRTQYMQHVGVVFGQRSQLWWELPVIESFRLFKEIYKIDTKEYQQNMHLFNDLVSLNELHSTPVRNLSLGQRMLCEITAAFLHNPPVIFLDEPTIGLDVSVKSKIRTLITNLNQTKKSTILLTTHDISDIEKLCRRIVIIDDGNIIYDGDINTFYAIYGGYRTLTMMFPENTPITADKISTILKKQFKGNAPAVLKQDKHNCFDILVNQHDIKLLDVMSFLLNTYSLDDIKIKDVNLENIIKKVYEGTLSEEIPIHSEK